MSRGSRISNTHADARKRQMGVGDIGRTFYYVYEDMQYLYIQIDNKSFERVEQFKYLGTTLRNENSFQVEIRSRLK